MRLYTPDFSRYRLAFGTGNPLDAAWTNRVHVDLGVGFLI